MDYYTLHNQYQYLLENSGLKAKGNRNYLKKQKRNQSPFSHSPADKEKNHLSFVEKQAANLYYYIKNRRAEVVYHRS